MSDIHEPQEPRPEDEGRLDPEAALEVVAVEASNTPAIREPEPPPPAFSYSPPPQPPAPTAAEPEEDGEEEGMLRMSFLEHLEELRVRIIRILMGVGVGFALSLTFAGPMWDAVREPAVAALTELGFEPNLAAIRPTEAFTIVWVKLPILSALFIAAPWVLYQIWAFIAPGLYKRERRLATPFILSCAGLFILGGAFAYFVAFRFGLVFLLGIGKDAGITPMISVTEYFDLFVNVILGVALVFELPVLIFFLTLLRIASPRFLLRHSRYAILIIVILAAIITPTPDVVNLTIFAAPMIVLYFGGVFAGYLLVLSREGRRFPWKPILFGVLLFLMLFAGALYLVLTRYGFHLERAWPYLAR